MIPFKDFDETKIHDYSDEELKSFAGELEMKRSEVLAGYAEEVGVYFEDENFDVYSASGERKLKKAANKIAPALAGLDEFYEIIKKELLKREDLNEINRYSGKSNSKQEKMSTEEFLQKEEDKTWAIRSKIE